MSKYFLGIDLGHHSIVTASSLVDEPFQVTVDANGLSNRSTPSIIGIENNRVIFGEEAENRLISVPGKMVASIPSKFHSPQQHALDTVAVESSHLLSLFLKNYLNQVHLGKSIEFLTVAVPVSFSEEATQVVADAARLAGLVGDEILSKFDVIDHLDAAMTVLNKDPLTVAQFPNLVVVDCGYSQTSVGLMVQGKCVSKQSMSFGVSELIRLVADSLIIDQPGFLAAIQSLDQRFYFRFLKVCEKVLKHLSMLPSTVVDIGDFEESLEKFPELVNSQKTKKLCKSPIHVSRDFFEQKLSSSQFISEFKSLLTHIRDASADPIDRVELVGGGGRVPFISKFVLSVFENLDSVGRGLDGSSFAAVGAALWAAGKRGWNASRLDKEADLMIVGERLEGAKIVQAEIERMHALEVEKLNQKNLLEAYLYQLKYWLNEDPRGKTLLNKEKLEPVLEAAWDWFYAAENGSSLGALEFEEKLLEIKSVVESEGKEFFQLIEKERRDIDASLTANAASLAGGPPGETAAEKRAKHETLTNEQALKLASKNKDEGNDLFKHGTLTDAMNRYMRSINIIAKIPKNSMSLEDAKLADSILLASNLNMAQCVVRITVLSNPLSQEERDGLLKRGVACADAALAIEPSNSKAKYRKAVCLDRLRETEQAKSLIDQALKESPNDIDLKQLYDSLVSSLKQQQTKAKKFFSRMFQ